MNIMPDGRSPPMNDAHTDSLIADEVGQVPEVTALPQERDPDELEHTPRHHSQHPRHFATGSGGDSNGKWSPLTTFWNEMGDDKPPSKKRKLGMGQAEEEFDELEEEEVPTLNAYDGTGKARPPKHPDGSLTSMLDADSSSTLNGGGVPAKRECTRCIRSGTPCVVGSGASCLRCRAMHQSCSLVAGRAAPERVELLPKVPTKQERAVSANLSLRRRAAQDGELLDDILDIHDTLNGISKKQRRRSDDLPTTINSRSQTPDSPRTGTGTNNARARSHSPDLDEIIELAAGSAGQLGPAGSVILPRTRKRTTQKTPNKKCVGDVRQNEEDSPPAGQQRSRSQHPPIRVMRALLMTSRAGRLYSEAVEELSLFVEEQRYL